MPCCLGRRRVADYVFANVNTSLPEKWAGSFSFFRIYDINFFHYRIIVSNVSLIILKTRIEISYQSQIL